MTPGPPRRHDISEGVSSLSVPHPVLIAVAERPRAAVAAEEPVRRRLVGPGYPRAAVARDDPHRAAVTARIAGAGALFDFHRRASFAACQAAAGLSRIGT